MSSLGPDTSECSMLNLQTVIVVSMRLFTGIKGDPKTYAFPEHRVILKMHWGNGWILFFNLAPICVMK